MRSRPAVNADHALLLVQSNAGKVVLDNMTDRLYDGSLPNDVRPILSFSGAKRWVHGYRDAAPVPVPVPVIAALPAALAQGAPSAIAPRPVATGHMADSAGLAAVGLRSVRMSIVRFGPCAINCSELPGLRPRFFEAL